MMKLSRLSLSLSFTFALAASLSAPAGACPFVPNEPTCGEDPMFVDLPSPSCGIWLGTGTIVWYQWCDGTEPGGGSGDALLGGFALELDGAQLQGHVTTAGHTTRLPVVLVDGDGVVISRDWSDHELHDWHRAVRAGRDKPRRATLAAVADDGTVVRRYDLSQCRATGWSLQAGEHDTLLEVTRLTCDGARTAAIRLAFRALLGPAGRAR